MEEVLTKLNPNKAAGPDGVESQLLKECAKEMAPSTLLEIDGRRGSPEQVEGSPHRPNPQKGQQSYNGKLSTSGAHLSNMQGF